MKKTLRVINAVFLPAIVVGWVAYLAANDKITSVKEVRYRITEKQLRDRINKNKSSIVYFYHPNCYRCDGATPIIMEKAKDYGIIVKQFNVADEPKSHYDILDYPTIVYYYKGKKYNRLEGKFSNKEIELFYKNIREMSTGRYS